MYFGGWLLTWLLGQEPGLVRELPDQDREIPGPSRGVLAGYGNVDLSVVSRDCITSCLLLLGCDFLVRPISDDCYFLV